MNQVLEQFTILSNRVVAQSYKLPAAGEYKLFVQNPSNQADVKRLSLFTWKIMNDIIKTQKISPLPQNFRFNQFEEVLDNILEQIDENLAPKTQQTNFNQIKPINLEEYLQNKPQTLYNIPKILDPVCLYPIIEQNNFNSNHIKQPIFPSEVSSSSLKLIEDLDSLKSMIQNLIKQQKKNGITEISVDVEHHSQRSYLGITCLIQITDREGVDYIIDPFPIWNHMILLNEVTQNPNILKVLHGCESDIQWMSRDFQIYFVNIFDTFIASKSLQLNQYSLAYLCKHYLQITLDKKYQLADWTIRPIPKEMLLYARLDTHYLLYIFDQMALQIQTKGDISGQNQIENVYRSSQNMAKNVFKQKEENDLTIQDQILLDGQRDSSDIPLLKKIIQLRNHLGKKYDENSKTIISNYMLFKLADFKPKKVTDVYSMFGEHNINIFLKNSLEDLINIIKNTHNNVQTKFNVIHGQSIVNSSFQNKQLNSQSMEVEFPKVEIILDDYETKKPQFQSQYNQDLVNKIGQALNYQSSFHLIKENRTNFMIELNSFLQNEEQVEINKQMSQIKIDQQNHNQLYKENNQIEEEFIQFTPSLFTAQQKYGAKIDSKKKKGKTQTQEVNKSEEKIISTSKKSVKSTNQNQFQVFNEFI